MQVKNLLSNTWNRNLILSLLTEEQNKRDFSQVGHMRPCYSFEEAKGIAILCCPIVRLEVCATI